MRHYHDAVAIESQSFGTHSCLPLIARIEQRRFGELQDDP
jgi:hypothetical protein